MAHGAGRVATDDLISIRKAYTDCIGNMTLSVARMIERFLGMGMQTAVILGAIEETGFAPRPSAYYLRAILSRYAMSGILTIDDQYADQQKREQEQNRSNMQRWDDWYGM